MEWNHLDNNILHSASFNSFRTAINVNNQRIAPPPPPPSLPCRITPVIWALRCNHSDSDSDSEMGRPNYLIGGRQLSWIYFVRTVLNSASCQCFFFFCVRSFISGVHQCWWDFCLCDHRSSYIPSLWMVRAGCVFVHRLDLSLYSRPHLHNAVQADGIFS